MTRSPYFHGTEEVLMPGSSRTWEVGTDTSMRALFLNNARLGKKPCIQVGPRACQMCTRTVPRTAPQGAVEHFNGMR
jgi:hypothetical protein